MAKSISGKSPQHGDDEHLQGEGASGKVLESQPLAEGDVQAGDGQGCDPTVSLNPFADLESLNVGANYPDDGIKVTRKLLTMPLGSPDKRQFFRAFREEQDFIARIYERPVPGELRPVSYFVDPSLHGDPSLGRVLKTAKLVRCVYYDTHAPFLWAISVGQRDNAWSRTALDIVAAAEEGFVRCVPDGRNGYMIEYPQRSLGEPEWPELTRGEWFDLAFKGRVIDSFEHEAIRELLGSAG